VFFIPLATLFISLLSPFFGYIFLVSIGGGQLLLKYRQRVILFGVVSVGLIILYALNTITTLEIADLVGSVLIVSWIFMVVLIKTQNHTKALYYGVLGQIAYGIFRTHYFSDIYRERIETLFTGYEGFIGSGVAENGNGQFDFLLEQLQKMMIDYQMAIWTISMIFAVYIAALFLARRIPIKWQHHFLKLPYSVVYLFMAALLLAIVPGTRLFGLNSVMIMAAVLLIQGLAIVDFWCRKYLRRSRFVLLAAIILMFLNVFFAVMVSLLGLIDNWLDIRKINQI
jgi:hypothetical protein